MPKITAEIKKALSSLIEQEGSALELSRKTGISHSTFSKYMSGQIQKINQANWKILMPFLNPYLKNVDSVVINNNSGTSAGIVHGNMTTVSGQSESGIPADVFTLIMNSNMTATEKGECIRAILKK